MHYVRAAVRAFEMSTKMRVISPFTYLGWLVYPLTIAMTVVLGGVAVLALRRSRGEPGRPIPSSEPAPL